MTHHTQHLTELQQLLEALGLKYTDQDLQVVACNVAKFVLANEVIYNTNNSEKENI